MTGLAAVGYGILGLVVGSFVNVVVHRVPKRQSVARPRSRCPSCEHPIAPRDNIPLASWLVLRGRCRSCRAPISPRYPLLEALTGVLFAAAALRFPGTLAVLPYCLGFAGLVALSAIDAETHLLPKRVVWPLAGLVLTGFALTAAIEHRWDDLQRALLGSATSVLVVGLLWFVYPKGMGFGDVRLEVVLGMLLGWVGQGAVAAGLILAFLLGGVISSVLLVTRLRSRQDAIPFGPWLCLGCTLALLWPAAGHWLDAHYLSPLAHAAHTLL